MPLLPALLAAALAAAPAAGQKPGDRTATPQQVLGEMAPADPLAEAEQIAAAAAAHPLGSQENPGSRRRPAGRPGLYRPAALRHGRAPRSGREALAASAPTAP